MTVNLKVSDSLKKFLSDDGLAEFVIELLTAAAEYFSGQSADQKRSPLYRHFVRTNRKRYEFARLSPKYAKAKRAKVGQKPILVLSGDWKNNALAVTLDQTGRAKISVKPTAQPHYAQYLEKGTAKMPARPAFTMNTEDRIKMNEYLQRIVADKVGELALLFVSDLQEVKL